MYLDTPYLEQNGSISICGFEACRTVLLFGSRSRAFHGTSRHARGYFTGTGAFFDPINTQNAHSNDETWFFNGLMRVYGLRHFKALKEPMTTTLSGLPETKYPAYVQGRCDGG